jgi:hypothetical protein
MRKRLCESQIRVGAGVRVVSAVILDEEIIAWTSVDDRLPDDDVTVLVCAPGASEPVWLGYYDEGEWFSIDHESYALDLEALVTAWAKMPAGPQR